MLLLVISNQAQARYVSVLSYQEMLAKSDLVVIADPVSKTTDTKEEAFLPNIWRQDKDGNRIRIKSFGVETKFVVSAVLKGDPRLKRFTLHHYREAPDRDQLPGTVMTELNGPTLVRFDPSGESKRSYLLFLVRDHDGRFAPMGGQTDPGMKAISPIPFDLH
jgi:hypothetical protein